MEKVEIKLSKEKKLVLGRTLNYSTPSIPNCGYKLTKTAVRKILADPSGTISLKCNCDETYDLKVFKKRGGIQLGCTFFGPKKIAAIRQWAESR